MEYDGELKEARLLAVRDRVNGGTLEIGTAGFAQVVARFRLGADCAEIVDGDLVFGDMPKRAMATHKGPAVEARIVDAAGTVRAFDLGVRGESDVDDDGEPTDAEVTIAPDKDVKAGQTVELMGFRIIHG